MTRRMIRAPRGASPPPLYNTGRTLPAEHPLQTVLDRTFSTEGPGTTPVLQTYLRGGCRIFPNINMSLQEETSTRFTYGDERLEIAAKKHKAVSPVRRVAQGLRAWSSALMRPSHGKSCRWNGKQTGTDVGSGQTAPSGSLSTWRCHALQGMTAPEGHLSVLGQTARPVDNQLKIPTLSADEPGGAEW